MSEPQAPPSPPADPGSLPPGLLRQVRRHLPVGLLVVALIVALLHIAPFWAVQRQTPPGWTFTGYLNGSPDEMQYRMLMERSQEIGPIVDNRMTAEDNRPHIPMLFYFGVGKLSAWLGVAPGFVYGYLGSVLAFLLALGLFWTVDHFVTSRYQTWWIFLTLLFGGGLGAHLLLLDQVDRLRQSTIFQRIVTDGLANSIVFERYRNHYLFTSLFDTHFLFFLSVALLAVVALYQAVARFTIPRLVAAVVLFGAVTVLHIYDGVTLLFIGAGVVAVLWGRGLPIRHALLTLIACGAAVGGLILWQMLLYKQAGLAIPAWRAQSILFSELALAYPIAWGLIAWGLGRYWRTAGVKECFLLGWALGCTALTLSGPFYPYSDRGTLTLQVPLMIVAGAAYFARYSTVSVPHALIAVAVMGATPIWQLQRLESNASFEEHRSGEPPAYTWMSPEHQRLVEALRARATSEDVLIVDKSKVPWRTDDLWLTMGFPGRLYAGHYALTPDYARKRDELNGFFADQDPTAQAGFLRKAGIRFVYVREDQGVPRFEQISGLSLVLRTSVGALFEFRPAARVQ